MTMNDATKKIIELLDSFSYKLSDYVGDNKYLIVDDHIELAKYLVSNGVAVQRHGYWIEDYVYAADPHDRLRYKCSMCGRTEEYKEPYCNCGAKMDGGK
jgi:hypothetical protein